MPTSRRVHRYLQEPENPASRRNYLSTKYPWNGQHLGGENIGYKVDQRIRRTSQGLIQSPYGFRSIRRWRGETMLQKKSSKIPGIPAALTRHLLNLGQRPIGRNGPWNSLGFTEFWGPFSRLAKTENHWIRFSIFGGPNGAPRKGRV